MALSARISSWRGRTAVVGWIRVDRAGPRPQSSCRDWLPVTAAAAAGSCRRSNKCSLLMLWQLFRVCQFNHCSNRSALSEYIYFLLFYINTCHISKIRKFVCTVLWATCFLSFLVKKILTVPTSRLKNVTTRGMVTGHWLLAYIQSNLVKDWPSASEWRKIADRNEGKIRER